MKSIRSELRWLNEAIRIRLIFGRAAPSVAECVGMSAQRLLGIPQP